MNTTTGAASGAGALAREMTQAAPDVVAELHLGWLVGYSFVLLSLAGACWLGARCVQRSIGKRAASEALEFAALFTRFEDASLADAFDLVMMQKILPKLSGTRRDVGGLITELIAHTASPLLPISNDKLQRMERRLEQVQYTGFVE